MVSDSKTFTNKGCKIAAHKKVCFWANFALLSKKRPYYAVLANYMPLPMPMPMPLFFGVQ